jgi:hypothetical protein
VRFAPSWVSSGRTWIVVVATRIQPAASRGGKEGEKPATKGRPVARACSIDHLRSISRKNDGAKGRAAGGRGANEIRTSRRSQVSEQRKKSIPTLPAPGGGARYAPSVRRGCRLPFATARAKGASDNSSAWQRPSYRPSRCSMGILVPSLVRPSVPHSPSPQQPL